MNFKSSLLTDAYLTNHFSKIINSVYNTPNKQPKSKDYSFNLLGKNENKTQGYLYGKRTTFIDHVQKSCISLVVKMKNKIHFIAAIKFSIKPLIFP